MFKENLKRPAVDVNSRYIITRLTALRTKTSIEDARKMSSIFIKYGSLQSLNRTNRYDTIHQHPPPPYVTSMASLPSDTGALHYNRHLYKKGTKII